MKRTGKQEPRIRICPDYEETYGDDCIFMSQSYGNDPFPWQKSFIRDFFAHDESGKPLCITVGLDVPRQNGKNFCLEIAELFACAILGWHVLHTAHEVKTCKEAFRRLASYFNQPTRYPELYEMVIKPGSRHKPMDRMTERDLDIRSTNGQEAIYLHRENPDTGELENWGSIQFGSRSKNACRGFADIQMVVFDEGQELTDEQLAALMPTLSASSTGTRMMVYTGTPTPPGSSGCVMARLRDRIIDGDDPKAMWWSFSIDDFNQLTPEWEAAQELVYETNPSVGYTLDIDFVKAEFTAAPPLQFAQERLGWWIKTEEQKLITEANYEKCQTDEPPRAADCSISYGVKFAPNGAEIALAVCANPEDANRHLELMDVYDNRAQSLVKIAETIANSGERLAAVHIDGNGAQSLYLELTQGDYGISKRKVHLMKTREVVAASQMLKQEIDSHVVTFWEDEAQDRLKYSAIKSFKRPIGKEGWGFAGEDVTPIEAAANALYASKTTKRKPGRKLRIG